MTKYYVTNANGDWWAMENGAGDTLWIISEDKLKEVIEDFTEVDDISGDIMTHGKPVNLNLEKGN